MKKPQSWLSLLQLSDEYDRKARLVPSLISFLPLVPVVFVIHEAYPEVIADSLDGWWVPLIGSGTVCAVGGLALVHLASAMGNRLQVRLWPRWPYDAPTNVRLLPGNPETSPQQRAIWCGAIKRITALDIQSEVESGNETAVQATIKDAVERLRNHFRRSKARVRHQQESIRYGQARNLAGLRPVWLSCAVVSCAISWTTYGLTGSGLFWASVSTLVPVPLFWIAYRLLPSYVRARARYYCEIFYRLLEEEDA